MQRRHEKRQKRKLPSWSVRIAAAPSCVLVAMLVAIVVVIISILLLWMSLLWTSTARFSWTTSSSMLLDQEGQFLLFEQRSTNKAAIDMRVDEPPPVPSALQAACQQATSAQQRVPSALELGPPLASQQQQQQQRKITNWTAWCKLLTLDDLRALSPLQWRKDQLQHQQWREHEQHVAENRNNSTAAAKPSSTRILCIVYTTQGRQDKWKALVDTWASQCDGFLLASNHTTTSNSNTRPRNNNGESSSFPIALAIAHPGPESYKNMWQKVRCTWSFVYEHYGRSFDWFHMGGDDMWVLVNAGFRDYLSHLSTSTSLSTNNKNNNNKKGMEIPHYVGALAAHDGNADHLFHLGGPGYTLNRAALQLAVTNEQHGLATTEAKTVASFEDIFMGRTFENLDVTPTWTHDEDTGQARFLHFSPRHYSEEGRLQGWYRKSQKTLQSVAQKRRHPLAKVDGGHYVSPKAVAFHRVAPDTMRAYHAWLYGYCDDTLLD